MDKNAEFKQTAPIGLLLSICDFCIKTSNIIIEFYTTVYDIKQFVIPQINHSKYFVRCVKCNHNLGVFKPTIPTKSIFALCMHCKVTKKVKIDIYFRNTSGEKVFI